jgi:hypothetical protein
MESWIARPESWQRMTLVLTALVLTTSIAYVRHGRRSRRWRECLFLVTGGLVGGILGLTFTRLTFEISPVYYASLAPESALFHLPEHTAFVGFRDGFAVAGVACGLCLLLSGTYEPGRHVTLARLAARMVPIVVDAVCLAGAVGMVATFAQADPETIVWLLHVGATLGGSLGLGLVLRRLRVEAI